MDKARHKTPDFMKMEKNNHLESSEQIREYESYEELNSKNEIDFLNSEENTKNSLDSQKKVKIFKNTNKHKKQNNKYSNEWDNYKTVEVKNKITEICCSDKINEKCLIF